MRRRVAAVSALALLLGASATIAQADSLAPADEARVGSAQPRFAGYRLQEIRDWSPQTDPYAEFLRADVPLQPRNAPDRATQANPELASDAEVMLMQGDYGNAFFDTPIANNDFGNLAFSFWQYVDYFSPWHGAATPSTPPALYDPATSDWRNRGFEFGIVNIPNPAYTNAAHRNGVRSIATIYFDPAFRPGLTFRESFERDPDSHGYLIAEKLVEMARYYGFDGYFLNQEEVGDDSEFKPFMAFLHEQGLYTQWYDTNSTFDAAKAAWLADDEHGRIHDSVFVNYGWPAHVDESLAHAKAHGHDPFKEIFFGVEANQGKFSGAHPTVGRFPALYEPGTTNVRGSVALFTPSDHYQRGLDEDVSLPDGATSRPPHQTDELQWMVAERERMFFSGTTANPRDTGQHPGLRRDDVAVEDASGWVGVADFAPARSVIRGNTFHSDFTTGHGMQWFTDGTPTGSEWTDIARQSILPSWQWWIDTDGERPHVDLDHGRAERRWDARGRTIDAPFEPQGAYNGGSSLVIHGDHEAPATIHLFKTRLTTASNATLPITFKRTGAATEPFSVVLTFADAASTPVTLPVAGSGEPGEWTTATLDLGRFAGRTITSIGVQVAPSEGTQLNLGAIALRDGGPAPAAPTGLTLRQVFSDGQAVLAWDRADFADVDGYEVAVVDAEGRTTTLGGGYTGLQHVKGVPMDGPLTFRVSAIGKDGQRSRPATVQFDATAQVRDLRLDEAPTPSTLLTNAARPGVLDVRWSGDAEGACRVDARLVFADATASETQIPGVVVGCAAGRASVPVPVRDGHLVDVTVTPEGRSLGTTVRGRTHDALARMVPKRDLELSDGTLVVHTPTTKDWWKLRVEAVDGDGAATDVLPLVVRGDRDSTGMQDPRALPFRDGTLRVTLTDYAGNVTTESFPFAAGAFVEDDTAPTPPPVTPPNSSPSPSPTTEPPPPSVPGAPAPSSGPTVAPDPTPRPTAAPLPGTPRPGLPQTGVAT
ncbi:endo-beta-N-acetylglucosaminidase [uncultured Tessaracoccus sp.]|uniref:endo-beta-N-acetylglucosaminidase n=1 Tax=uncultured Tessaracoccus sp. TaxID=905023 RepID=UPI0025F6314E|nr:endo-beta-N-acetylglucosaminidase [uncultured Tessaracoccus sp.]